MRGSSCGPVLPFQGAGFHSACNLHQLPRLVVPVRLELTTSSFAGKRAIRCARGRGTHPGSRTQNRRIISTVLYRTELGGYTQDRRQHLPVRTGCSCGPWRRLPESNRRCVVCNHEPCRLAKAPGAPGEARTPDLVLTKDARYRLRYKSKLPGYPVTFRPGGAEMAERAGFEPAEAFTSAAFGAVTHTNVRRSWSSLRGSNPPPPAYEAVAPPSELREQASPVRLGSCLRGR